MISRKFELELLRFGEEEKFAEGELFFPRRHDVIFPPNISLVCPDTGDIWMKVRFQMPGKWSVNWRVLTVKAYDVDLSKFMLMIRDAVDVKGDKWFYILEFMMLMHKAEIKGFEFYDTGYYTNAFKDI